MNWTLCEKSTTPIMNQLGISLVVVQPVTAGIYGMMRPLMVAIVAEQYL